MFVIFAISKVYDGPNKSIKGTTNLQPGGGKKMQKLIVIMFNVIQ